MKKLLFSVLLFFFCAVLAILGCSGDDGSLPCLDCELCGKNEFNPLTEFCFDSTMMVYPKCNDSTYNANAYFCFGDKTYNRCGVNDVNEYDPQMQYCSNGIIKTYGTISYGGQDYKTVVIGSKTWMAENLNYGISNSACYGYLASNCTIYGRLYNWSAAMGFDESCIDSTCANRIDTLYRGICPPGWHIPSEADWRALMTAVGGDSLAGTKLKAASDWNPYQQGLLGNIVSGNGTNAYGYSVLPGGYGKSDDSFGYAGYAGYWWSAVEDSVASNAYYSHIYHNWEGAFWGRDSKSFLFSVRCLKN